MSETLTIKRLGAQGDGIAETASGSIFVPFALPGEKVVVDIRNGRGKVREIVEPSPARQEAACRHFGSCGGCAVQHFDDETYSGWKRDKVWRALQSKGIDAELMPLVRCAPASRRRVSFTARKTESGVLIGYNAAQTHHIVAIEECPMADAAIVSRLDELRELAGLIAATQKPFHMTVTATGTGLDIAATGSGKISEKRRRQASEFVIAHTFARLTVDSEIIVEREKPVIMFDDVPVALPSGSFLQAVPGAEAAMADLVSAHLAKAKHIADLFAGNGTFALRLAKHARIHAVEGDGTALAALDYAGRHMPGLKPVVTERRDLFHRPMTAKELDAFDGLVFDPPRTGAEDQCRQIARSSVRRVAAVSCNPGTFARDLAILVEGGYRVTQVVPIDQFLWSPHVEAVALLEKAKSRR